MVLLAANAFFVGAEFALDLRTTQPDRAAAQAGSRLARTTLHAMERVSQMMAGAQLGHHHLLARPRCRRRTRRRAPASSPVSTRSMSPDGLLHPIAFVIAMLIVVFLHVVLGEMVPKNIALAGPERSALVLGPPMYAHRVVLRPLIVVINALANGILRLLRIEPKDEVSSTFTREEVAALVEESRGEGLLAEDEYDRLAGALDFTEKTVGSGDDGAGHVDDRPTAARPVPTSRSCAPPPASAGSP